MTKNIIISVDNFLIRLNQKELDLIKKNCLTHDLENNPHLSGVAYLNNDIFSIYFKCKNCQKSMIEYNKYSKIYFWNQKILNLSCNEYIIKGLLE